jgi:hypothetical protein
MLILKKYDNIILHLNSSGGDNMYRAVILLMILTFAFAGCSSSLGAPVVPQSESTGLDNSSNEQEMLGLYELYLDLSTVTGELVPLRETAAVDVLEIVDITNFLQMAPCTDCAIIKSLVLDSDGNIVVSIGIKHPFRVGDPFKPITGKNRADLHIFNIEGIVISDDIGDAFPGVSEITAGFFLANADGYTGYLDDALDDIYPTDATVHPYILHFDDYSQGNFDADNPMGFESVTDPPPSGNLVMAMGCDYDYQDYIFNLDEKQQIDFIFAIGCTYGVSASYKVLRFTPEYRIPQHNKKAASEIDVIIVSNDLLSEDTSSTAEIEIHVVDISHGVAVGSNLDEMLSDSSVDDIFVEIPGVMTDMLILDGSSSVSGSGHDPSDPLIYAGLVTNTIGAVDGTYAGLVKVTDNYTPGQNISLLLDGMDGIKRVDPSENPSEGLFDILEFASYYVFSIDVGEYICPVPTVTGINPDQGELDETLTGVEITGTGFIGTTATVSLTRTGQSDINATNVVVNSEISITCDIYIPPTSQTGYWNVVVINSCGNPGTGFDLFNIISGQINCVGQSACPSGPSSYIGTYPNNPKMTNDPRVGSDSTRGSSTQYLILPGNAEYDTGGPWPLMRHAILAYVPGESAHRFDTCLNLNDMWTFNAKALAVAVSPDPSYDDRIYYRIERGGYHQRRVYWVDFNETTGFAPNVWDGSTYPNYIPEDIPSGTIWKMTTDENGNPIVYSLSGTKIYHWNGSTWGSPIVLSGGVSNVYDFCYNPVTGDYLITSSADPPSLYAIDTNGDIVFQDNDIWGTAGTGSIYAGIYVDRDDPDCRVILNGSLNSTNDRESYFARYDALYGEKTTSTIPPVEHQFGDGQGSVVRVGGTNYFCGPANSSTCMAWIEVPEWD